MPSHLFILRLLYYQQSVSFSDKDRASKAAKWGLEAVEDMFRHETFQYEVELKVEGLPIQGL